MMNCLRYLQHNNTPAGSLCHNSISIKKILYALKKNEISVPSEIKHIMISVGVAESRQHKFDSTEFHNDLKQVVRLFKEKFNVSNINLVLASPLFDRDNDLQYWKNLQEVNKYIFFVGKDVEYCSFFNLFSYFVQRKPLYKKEDKWFNYVIDGKITYTIKQDCYKRINKDGSANVYDWNFESYETIRWKLDSFYSTFQIPLFMPASPPPKLDDDVKDRLMERIDGKMVCNLNYQMEEIVSPVDLGSENKDIVPKIPIEFGDMKINALLDTGCSHVLVNESLYNTIVEKYPDYKRAEIDARGVSKQFKLASGKGHPKITKIAYLGFNFNDNRPKKNIYRIALLVTQDLNVDLILGRSIQRDFGMKLDMGANKVEAKDPATGIRFEIAFLDRQVRPIKFELDPKAEKKVAATKLIMMAEKDYEFKSSDDAESIDAIARQNEIDAAIADARVNPDAVGKLKKLLHQFPTVFRNKIGLCNKYTHKLRFKGGKMPEYIWTKTRPIPKRFEKAVQETIERWERDDKIVQQMSHYKLPLVFVDKGEQKVRVCIDGRPLNQYLEMHSTETSNINNMRFRFHGMKFFTILDFREGFMQVGLDESQHIVISFVVNGVTYCMKVVGFGTKDSLAAFVRALQIVLAGCEEFVACYVDDLVIFSRTLEEHLEHIRIVLQKIAEAGMTLNLRKSKWIRSEIKYLGLILSDKGTRPDPEKVQTVLNFEKPSNVNSMQQYLGLFQYYRMYISKIAEWCQPLYDMTKSKNDFKWTEERLTCFDKLKNELAKETLLIYPNFDEPFFVYTDASSKAIAGVVMQNQKIGKENVLLPIAFSSRILKSHERSYSIMELELLAIMYTFTKNYYMLRGFNIYLFTDNIAVTYMKRNDLLPNRVLKWQLYLENFNIEIRHIAGIDNNIADFLSRYSFHITDNERNYSIFLFDYDAPKSLLDDFRRLYFIQERDTNLMNLVRRKSNRVQYDSKLGLFTYRGNDEQWRIYVPEKLQRLLIGHYHYEYGHLGITKLIMVIRRHFDWPALTTQTYQLVSRCISCQRASRVHSRLKGPMKSIVASEFNEIVCTDVFGPVARSTAGTTFILVIEDLFTKFVRLYAMKRNITTTIIEKFNRWIAEFGKPRVILSDNGPQFASFMWRDHWNANDIAIRYTSRYTPSSNPAERVMSTIGSSIRKYIAENQRSWFRILPEIEKKMNYTENLTTRCIPFELVKKRIVPDPIVDTIKRRTLPPDLEDIARENTEKNRKQRVEYFDKTNTLTRLKIGDLVMAKKRITSNKEIGVSSKLSYQWHGPFKVIDNKYSNVYELELVDNPNFNGICPENHRHELRDSLIPAAMNDKKDFGVEGYYPDILVGSYRYPPITFVENLEICPIRHEIEKRLLNRPMAQALRSATIEKLVHKAKLFHFEYVQHFLLKDTVPYVKYELIPEYPEEFHLKNVIEPFATRNIVDTICYDEEIFTLPEIFDDLPVYEPIEIPESSSDSNSESSSSSSSESSDSDYEEQPMLRYNPRGDNHSGYQDAPEIIIDRELIPVRAYPHLEFDFPFSDEIHGSEKFSRIRQVQLALNEGSRYKWRICVPLYDGYARQSYEWPRFETEVFACQRHFNRVRHAIQTSEAGHELVFPTRWVYDDCQFSHHHIISVRVQICGKPVTALYDARLSASIISANLVQQLEEDTKKKLRQSCKEQVIFVPWKTAFKVTINSFVAGLPVCFNPDLDDVKHDRHFLNFYIDDRSADNHCILGRNFVLQYVHSILVEPKLKIMIRGPTETSRLRALKGQEYFPHIRQTGVVHTLQRLSIPALNEEFAHLHRYLRFEKLKM
ncbi:unnamed protein product [Allacma fusca]|uniref:RNA-directed DNA polymerase n=1 Tax=Allacma fusca TaxID=39272 RepID=A0A8J2PED0_9HEXA|nr:unnamed protein product [Allacma fusca]